MFARKNRIGILKINAFILFLLIIFNTLPASAFASTDAVKVNTGAIGKGIVQIAYQSDSSKKVKVVIEKNTEKYTYDLKADGSNQSFPLQMGNGVYQVSILQNIDGTRYSYLEKESISLALADQNLLYLNSIQNINWNNGDLAANKAAELTKGLTTDEAKVNAIYNYIVNNFSYDHDKMRTVQTGYIPNEENTLITKKGICYDYASLFASMTRSVGIPCKLVKGYAKNVTGYHAWNEVEVSGKWIVVDTTSDMQLRAAKTTYAMEKTPEYYAKSYEY